MTKMYIVRHCEAEGNVKRFFQGTTDTDISDTGEKQLEYLFERFTKEQIDCIYSSPLKRAVKTALAIKGTRDMNIIDCYDLRELSGGIIEGKPIVESFEKYPDLGDAWINHPQDFAPQGGESMRSAYERAWKAVLNIAKENEGKTIAVATHGGVIRCLLCRLISGSIEELKNVPINENTAVCLIEFDDDFNAELKYYNDHSHLPHELLPARSRASFFREVKNG